MLSMYIPSQCILWLERVCNLDLTPVMAGVSGFPLPSDSHRHWRFGESEKWKKNKKKQCTYEWIYYIWANILSDMCIALGSPNKMLFSANFSYFSTKTYVVGSHQKCLSEALLISTHNICLCLEIRKILCGYAMMCTQRSNQPVYLSILIRVFIVCTNKLVCLCLCWGFTAQSTQWGHVECGQFT